nr:hypothetical protein [Methylobacterium sp. Leaf118]
MTEHVPGPIVVDPSPAWHAEGRMAEVRGREIVRHRHQAVRFGLVVLAGAAIDVQIVRVRRGVEGAAHLVQAVHQRRASVSMPR